MLWSPWSIGTASRERSPLKKALRCSEATAGKRGAWAWEVELWPCGYVAKCSARECRRRATTILRYLDNQERPEGQTEACDKHASELSAELRVIDRRR
jgi:hypothetical protein